MALYRIRKPKIKSVAIVKRPANRRATFQLFKQAPDDLPEDRHAWVDLLSEVEQQDLLLSDDELAAEIDRLRAEHDEPATSEHQLVDVMIPDGGWDGGQGCESKAPARARLLARFALAGERLSEVPERDLGCSAADAQGLAAGDLVLIGSAKLASFSVLRCRLRGCRCAWIVAREVRLAADVISCNGGRRRDVQPDAG